MLVVGVSTSNLIIQLAMLLLHFAIYNKLANMPISRFASLAIFVVGLTASFAWAWWQVGLFARSGPEFKCGLPILGIYGVTIICAAATSLLSTCLNALSFRSYPKPRSDLRILELVVLAAPAFLAALLIGAFLHGI